MSVRESVIPFYQSLKHPKETNNKVDFKKRGEDEINLKGDVETSNIDCGDFKSATCVVCHLFEKYNNGADLLAGKRKISKHPGQVQCQMKYLELWMLKCNPMNPLKIRRCKYSKT